MPPKKPVQKPVQKRDKKHVKKRSQNGGMMYANLKDVYSTNMETKDMNVSISENPMGGYQPSSFIQDGGKKKKKK
jgi:hypothetical protein